jgi:phosphopantothenoylcysteine decarboxylase/phosphopantothenate--cysteine ligase
MNTRMLTHPATQASLTKLAGWGVQILASAIGPLACGENGMGRLLEPDEVFKQIEDHLAPKNSGLRILITSGGTREPIDGVRSITNTSTGRTGSAIAEHFSSRGHQITFLCAEDSVRPSQASPNRLQNQIREIPFLTFQDLRRELQRELSGHHYDAVVHAAAVGDFSLESITRGGTQITKPLRKIEADGELTLHLKRNPFVVQNDLTEISGERHLARIISTSNPKALRIVAEAASKIGLAAAMETVLKQAQPLGAENFSGGLLL